MLQPGRALGRDSDAASAVAALERGTYLTTINFHSTPAEREGELAKQLATVARSRSTVTPEEIGTAYRRGAWRTEKPPVVLAFYNGYQDNFDVARPILDSLGLTAWFFVVTGWASQVQDLTRAAMKASTRPRFGSVKLPAMSWDEIEVLASRHVIASHTRSHVRVDLSDRQRLRDEILGSQQDLVSRLGRPAQAFAWLQGSGYGANAEADRMLHEAGYRYLVSNLRFQRLAEGRDQ